MNPNEEITTLEIKEVKELPPAVASDLQSTFGPLFEQAKQWEQKAKSLVVTDPSQTEIMKEAREARLVLKNIRTTANKKREELKQESLLKGRAIDGMFNIIKFLIVPLETHLEEQEKFIERQEEARLDQLELERIAKLEKYIEHVATIYPNIRAMSEEEFQAILRFNKESYEKKLAEEAEAEKQRIEEEKAREAERERLEKENRKLKAEQEKREAEEKKRREEEEARLEEERKARAKVEAELAAKKAAEEKALIEAEAEKKRAALAPDKEKLRKLAADLLAIDYPELTEPEAQKILEGVKVLMDKVNTYIVERVNNF